LKEAGHLPEAERAYRTAIDYHPSGAEAHLQLGHVLKIQGKKEEARTAYLRAVVLDPSLNGMAFEFSQLGWSEAHVSALNAMLQPDGCYQPIPEDQILERVSIAAASGIEKKGSKCDAPETTTAVIQEVVQPENQFEGNRDYSDWVRLYDTIDNDDRAAITAAIGQMRDRPLISVVMPVYNTPEPYLRAAIDSVRQQLYPNWELCIADDASTAPHVRTVLEHLRAIDPRIKVCYRSENGHISVASNSALALATGRFIALLDHDDVLPEHALYMVAAILNSDPEVDLIYSDEDKIDENCQRYDAYFKSDWNLDLMLSQNMFSHLGVYRRDLVMQIGGFRQGYEGSQDYDLVLRAQSRTTPARIRHIPHILYHWRAIPGSEALGTGAKPYALDTARRAIASYHMECGVMAEVVAGRHPAFHRTQHALPQPAPRTTIIIPTRDRVDLLRVCVDGLLHRTDYPDLEVLIVDNQSKEAASHHYFKQLEQDARVHILSYNAPFNFSAINNFAVARATGSLLCFLNNDVEVITRDWLTEMASHALRPEIGAVGALLYYPDGRIQHGGVIVGLPEVAVHAHFGLARGDYGYFGRAAVVQNVSAVTAACLVMRKTVFDEVGGLNETDLAVAYNDVDLCLRLGEAGYRIVWTPHAELFHHESASRGPDTDSDNAERFSAEVGYMSRRWRHILDRDPYYNPNLRLSGGKSGLAFPPGIAKPWQHGEPGQVVPPSDPPSVAQVNGNSSLDPTLSEEIQLISQSGLFDPTWYLEKHKDVQAGGLDPIFHYLCFGAEEGRDPHPLFDSDWYLLTYPDVAAAGMNPLVHYLRSGAAEGRASHPPLVRVDVPDLFELRGLQPRGNIAVVLHLYYPDLWDEMRRAIERISQRFDLFVTLVRGASEHMRTVVKRAFPDAYVFDFENRGRDIGPFLVLLQSGVLFRYELVCKLHTKRSPHEEDGDTWRRTLVDGVLGSSYQIDQIVSSFQSDPDLGIIVADGNIYCAYEHWASNKQWLSKLLPRVGISPDVEERAFPGGSVFWIRSFLLRTLAGVRLGLDDFEPEPLQVDGGMAHAVERMFGLICEDAGMRVVERGQLTAPPHRRSSSRVHVIAYYLPQFHPTPENDEWWGAGFTEWANVTRARPLFKDHRQPRLPADLGFYDLRLAEAREVQAGLARRYGLAAFCYYYYWFDGRRILQRPLDEVLATGKPDFPFMICWANEPWTRNWDGLNSDILLPQTYQPGWATRFAHDIAPLLRDRRYFRLDGKPMLLIYRIGHIPAAEAVVRELRASLLEAGVPKVHLAAAWVDFPKDLRLPADPGDLSLDAYFEFPPHMLPSQLLRPVPPGLSQEFVGKIYDYNRTVTAALRNLENPIEGQRHRAAMAGWDNTARTEARAHVFHGATPTSFRRWLRGIVSYERQKDGERVIFINAWNEWGEGTYLEPDRDFGRGWLEAVASAVEVRESENRFRTQ
jgi:lipopolysaccharide biosynthesis protein/GT2 family glycosyltransferase